MHMVYGENYKFADILSCSIVDQDVKCIFEVQFHTDPKHQVNLITDNETCVSADADNCFIPPSLLIDKKNLKPGSFAETDPCLKDIKEQNCGRETNCKKVEGKGLNFECACAPGFETYAIVQPFYDQDTVVHRCQDIDECLNQKACPNRTRCLNSYGSYECVCLKGFRPLTATSDPKISGCVDVCDATVCKHGKCQVIGEVYGCLCDAGYTGLSCDLEEKTAGSSGMRTALIILSTLVVPLILFSIFILYKYRLLLAKNFQSNYFDDQNSSTINLPSTEETNAIISDNGHVSVDAREAAEALSQHYANESRLAFSSYDKHFARVTRNQVKSCRDRPADNPLFNLISPYLNKLMPFKIWTPSNHLVQIAFHDIFCPTLKFWVGKDCYTYVTCLGKLLRQCKSAIFIPIHKPNKNAGLTTSYRPISFKCITCKLMESMVLRRLTHHLHTNNLMPSEQFAFRKGHSTVDQILYFTQCVRDSQNHKPTGHTMAAFLDVSKAFDRVLQEFADNHKITFNASKCSVSLFTTNRHLYNYSPEIFLMSEGLNYSKYPTYLGFTLDLEVNCGKHIEKIADKARKRLKILKYLSGRDLSSDASTLRITYTTLVCPVLEYGYQIFQVASPTNLKKLERV
ncbi:uncharacterized protein TNCV_4067651 [Trichonephila clavipes]|nr:uncharacterized protein TNCV_4067651 [Trichonephila clavipes]